MHVFSLIDVKALLAFLVGDAVPNPFTEHHLVAVHEIVHYILQLGHEVLEVNQVEIYEVHRYQLDPNVAFYEVDEASRPDCVVKGPLHFVCYGVPHLLEEQHFG